MKKILAFSLGMFFILALSSMNSNVMVSARSADIQSAEEDVTKVTAESWHVGGMDIESDSASVGQEEQVMSVIATTQTVTEKTAGTVDGTTDLVIPTIEATTTDVDSQNDKEFADEIIPSVAASKTAAEGAGNEIFIDADISNADVEEQGTVKETVEGKRATVLGGRG